MTAKFISVIKPNENSFFIVASNYGGRIDPNASELVEYIKSNGGDVICISNSPMTNSAKYEVRGRFKSYYLFFSAQAVFYTHSLSDVIPHAHKLFFLKAVLNFPKLVFLQHGVIGLKSHLANGASLGSYLQSLESTFDDMLVSSDDEKNIVSSLGVGFNKITTTGLPRFDAYIQESIEGKDVFVFLSWQDNDLLMAKLDQILNSSAISRLELLGYKVTYATHDMQLPHNFSNNRMVSDISTSIGRCKLLITDDSSVAWDVFYRGQEVIFYKPSNDWLVDYDYLEQRKCFNLDGLYNRVEDFLTGHHSGNISFAKYVDQSNCERVLEVVGGIHNDQRR